MSRFRRREERKVTTVLSPSIAARLEEVTDRLERMVETLQERVERFDTGEQENTDA